jgi:hypothetical protein
MSDTETTIAAEVLPQSGVVQKPNGKGEKNKIFPTKLGRSLKPGKDDFNLPAKVENIGTKNTWDRSCEFRFDLIAKKGACRHRAISAYEVRV